MIVQLHFCLCFRFKVSGCLGSEVQIVEGIPQGSIVPEVPEGPSVLVVPRPGTPEGSGTPEVLEVQGVLEVSGVGPTFLPCLLSYKNC